MTRTNEARINLWFVFVMFQAPIVYIHITTLKYSCAQVFSLPYISLCSYLNLNFFIASILGFFVFSELFIWVCRKVVVAEMRSVRNSGNG